MTTQVFLQGRLCDPELFQIVTGTSLSGAPATQAGAQGLFVNLGPEARERLAFYAPEALAQSAEDGTLTCHLDDVEDLPLERLAAEEYMGLIGTHSAEKAARAMPQIRMRAASRQRAMSDPSPATLKPPTDSGAVRSVQRYQPYTDYFAVREDDLTFPRFSGSQSAEVRRASFMGGDAVTVLPYDPHMESVLVVRQFRHGPFARGDSNPWTLEPAAGRIDPGEAPEETARRELMEETGVTSGALHFVGRYYPSPGAFSEYLYSYIAVTDLSDRDGSIGGLETEAEDIMAHVIKLEDAMAMIQSGEINTAPLILSLGWLALNRQSL